MDTGPISAARLRAWSEGRGEPAWLRRRRLSALERLGALAGEQWSALEQALEDRPGRPAPIASELAEQGIEVVPLAEAMGRFDVERAWGSALRPHESATALVAEAFWTGGLFVRVPRAVRAQFPLQVAAGLQRLSRVERATIVIEEGGELEYVEGCSQPAGAAGARWSLVDAVVGEQGRLSGGSVQAWPFGARSFALKRARVGKGGRLEWADANLWACRIEKTIELSLAEGAFGDVLCGGFAAAGQRQTLSLTAAPSAAARLEILAATKGDGAITAQAPTVRRLRDRFWPPDSAGRRAEADALHGFFDPLSRRLPLEFSVEFSRLLEAAL